jgi:hypothetical protein
MKNTFAITTILFISLMLNAKNSSAQCKGFTKRNCLPELTPYSSNGQLNSAQLFPEEDAEIQLNLNKGLSYRILVCADPYLEDLTYKLYDQNEFEIFSDTLKNYSSIKDLKVTQSQNLKMKIDIPQKKNTTGIKRSGCVTIMLGYKE